MKKIISITVTTTFFYCIAYSQDSLHTKFLGLGFQVSRSSVYGDGGVTLCYFHKKNVQLDLGIGQEKYRYICAVANIQYSPFYKFKRLAPIIGLGYTIFPSRTFSMGPNEQQISTFNISRQQYLIPQIGLRRDFDNGGQNFISITAFISYRFAKENERVEYIRGFVSPDFQIEIHNRISEKIGFGVKAVVTFTQL